MGKVELGKGLIRGSWSFGTLKSTKDFIKLSAPILGDIILKPTDVIALHDVVRIPVFYWGIEIEHNNDQYPRTIRFTALISPTMIIEGIKRSGFTPQGKDDLICLNCDSTIPEDSDLCPDCGWSYHIEPGDV